MLPLFTFRLKQRWYVQTVMRYAECQLEVFSGLSRQALPQVNQAWVVGLNQSKECQPIPPTPPKVMNLHFKPTNLHQGCITEAHNLNIAFSPS